MNCKKCQQLLYEYRDETLDSFLREDVGNHLEICSACREVYAREEQLARDFRQLAVHLQERLSDQIQEPPLSRFSPGRLRTGTVMVGMKWGLAAALGLLLFFMAGLLFHPPAERQPRPEPLIALRQEPGGGHPQAGRPGGNGLLQVISIEDETGNWSETHFRRENGIVITDITVEVSALRVLNGNPSTEEAVTR
jgi:hypothetical protein